MRGRCEQTLVAFYDLAVAPATFDIVLFLVLANAERQRRKSDRLHVMVVPGPNEGFRSEGNLISLPQARWRVHNVLVSACRLLPGVVTASVLESRDAARCWRQRHPKSFVFPADYDPDAPYPRHHFPFVAAIYREGFDVQPLRAPIPAQQFIAHWLHEIAKERPVVTLALRESNIMPERNSRVADWAAFARRLERDGYQPVIVRDLGTVAEPLNSRWGGAVACSAAVFNLELRAALYEASEAVLQVNSGPAALAHYNANVNYATLKMLADSPVTTATYMHRMAQPPGASYPFAGSRQRLIWAEDDLPGLIDAFAMVGTVMPTSVATRPSKESPPDESGALITLAGHLYRTGATVAALQDYERLVRLAPSAKTYHGWAMALAAQGAAPAALAAFEQAHAMAAPGERRHSRAGARVALELVETAVQHRDWAGALDACDRAIALDAGDHYHIGPIVRATVTLTRQLLAVNAFELAERVSNHMLSLLPTSEHARRAAAAVQATWAEAHGTGPMAAARHLAAFRLRFRSKMRRRSAALALASMEVPAAKDRATWTILVESGAVRGSIAILEASDPSADAIPVARALLDAGPWFPRAADAAARGAFDELAAAMADPSFHDGIHGRLLRALLAARRLDDPVFATWFIAARARVNERAFPTLDLLAAMATQAFWREYRPAATASEQQRVSNLSSEAHRSPGALLTFALYHWPGAVQNAEKLLTVSAQPSLQRFADTVLHYRPGLGPWGPDTAATPAR